VAAASTLGLQEVVGAAVVGAVRLLEPWALASVWDLPAPQLGVRPGAGTPVGAQAGVTRVMRVGMDARAGVGFERVGAGASPP
jgi:hypothetical protein